MLRTIPESRAIFVMAAHVFCSDVWSDAFFTPEPVPSSIKHTSLFGWSNACVRNDLSFTRLKSSVTCFPMIFCTFSKICGSGAILNKDVHNTSRLWLKFSLFFYSFRSHVSESTAGAERFSIWQFTIPVLTHILSLHINPSFVFSLSTKQFCVFTAALMRYSSSSAPKLTLPILLPASNIFLPPSFFLLLFLYF